VLVYESSIHLCILLDIPSDWSGNFISQVIQGDFVANFYPRVF